MTAAGKRLELLAPAGDAAALQAALSAGADAVYVGLERWSARAQATNFGGAAVLEAIEQAHRFGARLHLALNTLLKQGEISLALAALEEPYAAGLDALIVADLGLAALVRERFPDLPLHASTQLNVHSSAQLGGLAAAGFARAILARELSLDEIAALDTHGLELEVFVHGALCYGYSGLCLLASMVGGRSANRGRCSQACRLRYRLLGGGQAPPARARTTTEPELVRALSTADLAAIAALPALIAAGVTSFKIEGRMKDAGYVAVTTAVYREALAAASADPEHYVVRDEWLARLSESFSRSFTNAHLEGHHWTVRAPRRGAHRGTLVGRVERVERAAGLVTVRLQVPVRAGDVLRIYTPRGQTQPLPVGALAARADESVGEPPRRLWNERLTLSLRERVAVNDRVFRVSSEELEELRREAVTARGLARPLAVDMRLQGRAGEPARLTLSFPQPPADEPIVREVSVRSAVALAPARAAALTDASLREALGALGGTPYRLRELRNELDGALFLPVAALKDMRRRAIHELDERRLAARRRSAAAPPAAARSLPAPAPAAARAQAPVHADVIVRVRPGQRPLLAPQLTAVCLDLEPFDSVETISATLEDLRRETRLAVRCRPTEILFDGDLGWWRAVAALPWDAVYARHIAHLDTAAPVILEYPLQGFHAEVARRCSSPDGLCGRVPTLAGVVVSPEASLAEIAQLAGLLRGRETEGGDLTLEVMAFGRQQLLVSRDELGRAEGLVEPQVERVVSTSLVDAKGFVFPVTVAPTTTRLFNARVTNLAANVGELQEAGVSGFIVVQSDLSRDEADAFRARGLGGLAAFAGRERSTTAHIFRGVS